MAIGRVKWFSDTKGFGFIEQEGDKRDVYVHYSAISSPGFRRLEEGDPVEFDLVETENGPEAVKVRKAPTSVSQ